MNKNNFLNHKLFNKSNIALACVMLMMLGFLVSRSLLSFGTFAFGVNALWNVHPRRWLQQKWWLLGVAWVAMYAVSYFWSNNVHYWDERFQVKLPVLLLPLAFAFTPRFSDKQLKLYTVGTAILLLAGTCYSYLFLYRHLAYIKAQYLVSHILPTPVNNDHIRFSLSIVLFIIWSIYFWPRLGSSVIKWFLGATIVFLILYLYILAAKSGLITLFIFVFFWAIYLIISKKVYLGLIAIAAIFSVTYLAFKYLPTFSMRIGYVQYTYDMYKRGDVTGNYGDIDRLMSYNVSAKVIKDHPIGGVGSGDILDEMKKGYDKWYPLVKQEDRLLPHNQFLTVALACGIPAALLFTLWVFAPLSRLKRNRAGFFFFIIWVALLFQLMVEPVLEVQFGVFVYLFFILWQRQELLYQSVKEE